MRRALLISNTQYADERLRRLRSPARDVAGLADVLGDPDIGGFRLADPVNDEPEHVIRRAIAGFLRGSDAGDLLLLYISGHGLKDEEGDLYFAARDTELELADATAVPGTFVNRQLGRSPSRQIAVILDCCYSGAFPAGLVARSDAQVHVGDSLGGRGRVILTSSRSTEYSFEGGVLTHSSPQPSVFTAAVIEGLRTGEADLDGDGWVTVDELYRYVYSAVRKVTPHQTPTRAMQGAEGDLRIARRPPRARRIMTPISPMARELIRLIERTQFPTTRLTRRYDIGVVDDFLDQLIGVLRVRPAEPIDVTALTRLIRAQIFGGMHWGEGYKADVVDVFLETVALRLTPLSDPHIRPEGG